MSATIALALIAFLRWAIVHKLGYTERRKP